MEPSRKPPLREASPDDNTHIIDQDSKQKSLSEFSNDVLMTILDKLDPRNHYDLLNLALVSKHFYMLVMHNYFFKHFDLDLDRGSHRALLQEMLKDGSLLPGRIRYLTIKDGHTSHAAYLHLLIPKMKMLEKITWVGSPRIPEKVDKAICKFAPHCDLELVPTIIDHHGDDFRSGTSALRLSNVSKQLTGIHFTTSCSNTYVLERLRSHLLCLVHKHKLRALAIVTLADVSLATSPRYEHMLFFGNFVFPPLEDLKLGTSLLSVAEVSMWASRGGFETLTSLELHDPAALVHFAGKVPNLHRLCIIARPLSTTQHFELVDQMSTLGELVPGGKPFGCLQVLRSMDVFTDQNRHRMGPATCKILQMHGQDLRYVYLHSSTLIAPISRSRIFNGELDSLSVYDLRQIGLCPKLERLSIDLTVHDSWGRIWPLELMRTFASLPIPPVQLDVYCRLHGISTATESEILDHCRTLLHAYCVRTVRTKLRPIHGLYFKVARESSDPVRDNWSDLCDFDIGFKWLDGAWHILKTSRPPPRPVLFSMESVSTQIDTMMSTFSSWSVDELKKQYVDASEKTMPKAKAGVIKFMIAEELKCRGRGYGWDITFKPGPFLYEKWMADPEMDMDDKSEYPVEEFARLSLSSVQRKNPQKNQERTTVE